MNEARVFYMIFQFHTKSRNLVKVEESFEKISIKDDKMNTGSSGDPKNWQKSAKTENIEALLKTAEQNKAAICRLTSEIQATGFSLFFFKNYFTNTY